MEHETVRLSMSDFLDGHDPQHKDYMGHHVFNLYPASNITQVMYVTNIDREASTDQRHSECGQRYGFLSNVRAVIKFQSTLI